MKLDATYWNDRYKQGSTAWDLGRVSAPMRAIIDSISDKNIRILIPGAGNSHEAQYVIQQGFTDITVLDYASAPLDRLKGRGLDLSRLTLVNDDFFGHDGTYDLILEQTFFCALELRFRESYPLKIHQLLSNGGMLKGVLFNFPEQRTEPPYTGTVAEYKGLFEPLFEICKLEPAEFSEPDRAGKELYIELKKD